MMNRALASLGLLLLASTAQATQTITITDPTDSTQTVYTFPSNFTFVCSPACGGGNSPDGTISVKPNGAPLTNASGTWVWGRSEPSSPSNWDQYLSGVGLVGYCVTMEVAHGGKMYCKDASNVWYIYNTATGFYDGSPAP